jgi:hypothetical protein
VHSAVPENEMYYNPFNILARNKMKSNVLPAIKRTLLIVSLLLISIAMQMPMQALAAEDGSGLDAAIYGTNELFPGDDTYIQISIQNNKTISEIDPLVEQAGLSEYYGAAVGLTLELNKGTAPVSLKTNKMLLGTLPMGMSVQQLPFLLEVDENAVAGNYQLNLLLTYSELEGVEITDAITGQFKVNWTEKTETISLEIMIGNNYETDFEVTDIEADLQPGKRSEIKVTFKNTGNSIALDSVAKLSNAVAPLHLTDDTAFLGIVEPGGTAIGIFEIKVDSDAVEKSYSLDAEIKYSDQNTKEHISDTVIVQVDVTDKSLKFSNVISDKLPGVLIGAAVVVVIWLISFLIGRSRKKRLEK